MLNKICCSNAIKAFFLIYFNFDNDIKCIHSNTSKSQNTEGIESFWENQLNEDRSKDDEHNKNENKMQNNEDKLANVVNTCNIIMTLRFIKVPPLPNWRTPTVRCFMPMTNVSTAANSTWVTALRAALLGSRSLKNTRAFCMSLIVSRRVPYRLLCLVGVLNLAPLVSS